MKIKQNRKLLATAVILTLITTVPVASVAAVPADAIAQTNIPEETEKINNIKTLLNITGAANLAQQIIQEIVTVFKSEYPQVPAKFWENFLQEINPNDLVKELIPIYTKYFTNEEIKQLIAFYQTPIGKKILNTLPEISRESAIIGERYGREAAQRAIKKLEAEGYIRRGK